MVKARKLIVLLLSITVVFVASAYLFMGVLWSDVFHVVLPSEIAIYHSPNGEYSLVFEQMGEPEWPFGATDVRLTLKDQNSSIIGDVSVQIHDDGANANEHHIVSISWNHDAVVVILRGSEMQDKEVAIPYNQS